MNRPSACFCVFLLFALILAVAYSTVTVMGGLYIASDLGGSSDISTYPMVFFLLGNLLGIPLTSPLIQRWGAIHLLVYSLFFYAATSVLCAFAPTFFLFNVFRFLLGFTSGPIFILCRRLLIERAPASMRQTALFYMLLIYAVIPVVGASLGAWAAYESHWRWIFHINEPLSLLLAGYFWFGFRHLDPPSASFSMDWVSYLFFSLGISALFTAITMAQELDWFRSSIFVALLSIGIPSFLFFLLWDIRSEAPLFHFQLFSRPVFSYACLNLAILFSSYFGMIILISLWLNTYTRYTPWWISLLLSTMALAGLLAFLLGRTLLRKFDPRFTLMISISCFMISCYYSTFFSPEVDFFHLAVARFLAGLGLVFFLFPLIHLAVLSFKEELLAHNAFCIFQSIRVLSSGLGVSIFVTIWQRRQVFFHERLGELITPTSPLTAAYFQRAEQSFGLSAARAHEELNGLVNEHATSLALNDVFGCMGYILLGLLGVSILSFWVRRHIAPLQNN